jgi:hypothetical protein
VLGSSLDISRLYEMARGLLASFNSDSGFQHDQVSREVFQSRVVRTVTQAVSSLGDGIYLRGFLLPRILNERMDLDVMQRVTIWLEKRE